MRHHSVGRRRWLRHPLIDERDVGGVVRAMLPVKSSGETGCRVRQCAHLA